MPKVTAVADVDRTLVEHADRGVPLSPTNAAAFFLPLALLVTGPLHIVWNAFENAMKGLERWLSFKEFLSAILSLLGNAGLRARFIDKCLRNVEALQCAWFYNWKHHVIDWKWEYMEARFKSLSIRLPLL